MKRPLLTWASSLALSAAAQAGILLHLDAGDLAALNDGDPVTTWGPLTQGNAANQPTFQSTGLNGKPTVRFDGGDDFLESGDLPPEARSIVAVATIATGAGNLDGLLSNGNDRLNLRHDPPGYRAEGNDGDNNEFYRHDGNVAPADNNYVNGTANGSITFDVSHVVIANSDTPADYNNLTVGWGGIQTRYWTGDISEVYIFDQALTQDEIIGLSSILADRWMSPAVAATQAQIAAGNAVLGIINDSDMDGMDDNWEQAVADSDPNDNITSIADINPDENLDGDDLTNLQEFEFPQTDPLDEDSDDDGLLDHVETGDGSFNNLATDTGTDPNNPDTDGDGLPDGVETNDDTNDGPTDRGTDPLDRDSDGDGTEDKDEIDAGFDPNDPGSSPVTIAILGTGTAALLGGDLTDPEDDIIDSEPDDGTPLGQNANWVGVTASSELMFSNDGDNGDGGHEAALDVFDNKVGGGEAKWCCDRPPQDLTVEFETPVTLTHFTISSSNDSPQRDPRTWAILGSNNGVDFTPIFERDSETALWTERNQVARIDLNAPPPAYKFIRYAVTATGSGQHALGELEYFGSVGPSIPPQITVIDYDQGADTFRFTWVSKPGKKYTLRWSPDLINWGADVNDGIDSQGDSTTYPAIEDPAEPHPNPGAGQIFFRVEENPPLPDP